MRDGTSHESNDAQRHKFCHWFQSASIRLSALPSASVVVSSSIGMPDLQRKVGIGPDNRSQNHYEADINSEHRAQSFKCLHGVFYVVAADTKSNEID